MNMDPGFRSKVSLFTSQMAYLCRQAYQLGVHHQCCGREGLEHAKENEWETKWGCSEDKKRSCLAGKTRSSVMVVSQPFGSSLVMWDVGEIIKSNNRQRGVLMVDLALSYQVYLSINLVTLWIGNIAYVVDTVFPWKLTLTEKIPLIFLSHFPTQHLCSKSCQHTCGFHTSYWCNSTVLYSPECMSEKSRRLWGRGTIPGSLKTALTWAIIAKKTKLLNSKTCSAPHKLQNERKMLENHGRDNHHKIKPLIYNLKY